MKRYILIGFTLVVAVLVAITTQLQSQNATKICGKVTNDKTGLPVAAAAVMISGTTMGALTGPDGEYCIINVPPGSYTIVVKTAGFAIDTVKALTVIAGRTTKQDFSLVEVLVTQELQIIQFDALLPGAPSSDQAGKPTSLSNQEAPTSAPTPQQQVITAERDLLKLERKDVAYGKIAGCPPIYSGYSMSNGGNTPVNGQPYDAMFFKSYGTNPFISTEDDHLSTFAIDCDNASYAMTRSYLNSGYLPSDDAVRVEEFINNFDYHYSFPQSKAFQVFLEGAPSRFGNKCQLIKIGIAGKKIDPRNRKDANLTFIVDVSGSMAREERLGMVRRSLRMLVDNLTERDNVGIVAYGSNAFVVLEPTSIRNRDAIITAIERLYPSGSTNAEQGIRLGYQMADRNFRCGAINRIILCTDGVANVGVTGPDDILKQIKKYADKGITLSAIGFGMGNYNDVLLEKLGDKGNGHYAYVDNWDEAKRVFLENLTGTLQVIARDVKIQVDFDPRVVDRYRLLGYENRDVADNKFRDDKEDGGEIGSGHTVTALYEVRLKDGAESDLGTVYIRYKDPDNFAVSEIAMPISRNAIRRTFESTTSDFRLASAAAEFAEILRSSYWAKDSRLCDVLSVVRAVEREQSSDQVIELTDLIAKADKIKKDKEGVQEPIGMDME